MAQDPTQPEAEEPAEPEQARPADLLEAARADVSHCCVHVDEASRARWFERGYNNWYLPAVRRGYTGGFAPIFDVGLCLFDPNAGIVGSGAHGNLLNWIKDRPHLTSAAREVLPNAWHIDTQDEDTVASSVGEWTLIEPLLRCLTGVWSQRQGLASGVLRRACKPDQVSGKTPDSAAPRQVADYWQVEKTRQNQDHSLGVLVPNSDLLDMRLLQAQLAKSAPHLAARFDYELAEACFYAPEHAAERNQPPPLRPVDVSDRSQSDRPGKMGGVTRYEPRLPDDPWVNIIPPDWMHYLRDRETGLKSMILGDQTVVRFELEKDEIPNHRALVCLVARGQIPRLQAKSPMAPARRMGLASEYRDGYVYAKRMCVDLLRDLKEAEAYIRDFVDVKVDAALFSMSSDFRRTLSSMELPLSELPRFHTGDLKRDRMGELSHLATMMPEFFVRETDRKARSDSQTVDLGRYVSEAALRGNYHAIHLFLIGPSDVSALAALAHSSRQAASRTKLKMTRIDVDPAGRDMDLTLAEIGEPLWGIAEMGTPSQVSGSVQSVSKPIAVGDLRRRVVDAVFNPRARASQSSLARIKVG